jgi:hypothetical protein
MHRDYDELSLGGTTPWGEICAKVEQDTYYTDGLIEAKVFIDQLKRVFGKPPPSVYFKVVSWPYNLGTFYDVVIHYNNMNQDAIDYASRCEAECPKNWDAKARKELKEKGYSF